MITKWLIELVRWILSPIFSVLPVGGLSFLNPEGYLGTTHWIGHALGGWDGLLPVISIFQVLASTIAVILPALMLYKVANWIWKHIPDIAGFGPGSG